MSEAPSTPEDGQECDGACMSCVCGVPEYLQRNLTMVHLRMYNPHSWRCQIWSSFPLSNPWKAMWVHGLLPRNMMLCWRVKEES